MKRAALAATFVYLAVAAPAAQARTTQNVGVVGSEFRTGVCPSPPGTNTAKITVGDAVKWTNCDPMAHNITWKQQPGLPNRTLAPAGQPGDAAQQFFNRAGVYDYYCSIHGTPTSANMQGRVVVEDTEPTTTAATQPAPTTTAATVPPTLPPSTTTAPPSTTSSTTPEATTTPESTTTTTSGDDLALETNDDGASGGLVALLLLGIGAAVAGGIYLLQRMRAENSLGS